MLNNETINKIAAGEVIIRPVSVIKELVENAIDAGADQITVIIEAGGKNRITVRDNGCGIAYNDVPLAFKRHATSKLTTIEDLESILSLGFRGEALSSVSAVSKVSIITKYETEEIGSCTLFEGGKLINQRVCTYNQGTEITVKDLFYNTPARRKHLEKDKKEETIVRDMVEKIAMSYPGIRFKVSSNGRSVLDTPGTGKVMDVIRGLYGVDFATNLISLDYENKPMKLTGFVGNLKTMRNHREDQVFFINGRYIKNNRLAQALDQAYEGYMMKHQHPMGIIFIELPGRMLDVNIHPAKTEIKILNESLICLLFKQGIRETLRMANLIVEVGETDDEMEKPVFQEPIDNPIEKQIEKKADQMNRLIPDIKKTEEVIKSAENTKHIDVFGENEAQLNLLNVSQPENRIQNRIAETPVVFETQAPDVVASNAQKIRPSDNKKGVKDLAKMKIVGQLFNVYILLEGEKEIYLLDQHAAHEAFLTKELMEIFDRGEGLPSQGLMTPVPIKIRPRDADQVETALADYKKLGYECDVFGEDTLLVRSVPILLGEPQSADLLRMMIDENLFEREEGIQSATVFSDQAKNRIISMACKAAIKGGQPLNQSEIRKLLENLMELDNPFTCPHGRPIIMRLKEYELMKLFKRVL